MVPRIEVVVDGVRLDLDRTDHGSVLPDDRWRASEAVCTCEGPTPLADVVGGLLAGRDATREGGTVEVVGAAPDQVEHLRQLAGELGLRHRHDAQVHDARFEVLPRFRTTRPTVSIVIPAYRATFLRECLDSAFAQTYPDLEVVLADDCPTDAVAEVVDAHPRRGDIRVLNGPNHRLPDTANRSGRATYLAVHEAAGGEYVKFLNDDDLLLPDCVERFATCLDTWPQVTLATSHRRLVDAEGRSLPDLQTTTRILPYDAILDGRLAVSAMIRTNWNFLGEPTTAMWRASDARLSQPDFLSLAGRLSPGNVDMHLWASLGLRGDIAYLADTLSVMRLHPDQMQNRAFGIERGNLAQQNLRDLYDNSGLFVEAPSIPHMPIGHRPWWPAAFTSAMDDFAAAVAVGATNDARNALSAATAAAADDPVQLTHVSEQAAEAGLDGVAMAVAEQAIGQPPHHPTAVLQFGLLNARRGNHERARECATVLQQTCPHSAVVDAIVQQLVGAA